jgi:hypothetical protein
LFGYVVQLLVLGLLAPGTIEVSETFFMASYIFKLFIDFGVRCLSNM